MLRGLGLKFRVYDLGGLWSSLLFPTRIMKLNTTEVEVRVCGAAFRPYMERAKLQVKALLIRILKDRARLSASTLLVRDFRSIPHTEIEPQYGVLVRRSKALLYLQQSFVGPLAGWGNDPKQTPYMGLEIELQAA